MVRADLTDARDRFIHFHRYVARDEILPRRRRMKYLCSRKIYKISGNGAWWW